MQLHEPRHDTPLGTSDQLVLTASRRKWLGMLAINAVFVAGGLLIAVDVSARVLAGSTLVFFGTGLLMSR